MNDDPVGRLRARYSSLATSELEDLWRLETLTDQARPILREELEVRGLTIETIASTQTPEQPDTVPVPDNSKRNLMSRLWSGDVRLVYTYWLFGWIGGLVVGVGATILDLSIGTPALGSLIGNGYAAFMMVPIWRSANKYRGRVIWRNGAEGVVILTGVYLVIMFALAVIN